MIKFRIKFCNFTIKKTEVVKNILNTKKSELGILQSVIIKRKYIYSYQVSINNCNIWKSLFIKDIIWFGVHISYVFSFSSQFYSSIAYQRFCSHLLYVACDKTRKEDLLWNCTMKNS